MDVTPESVGGATLRLSSVEVLALFNQLGLIEVGATSSLSEPWRRV